MRISRVSIATGLFLAALSFVRADSNFGQQWMDHYYQNPQPNKLLVAVYSLNRSGYLESKEHAEAAIGFFSTVFAENPDQVQTWLRSAESFASDRVQRILAASAWLAKNPAGPQELRKLRDHMDSDQRDAADKMLAREATAPVAELPVASDITMNLQWGAFLATGQDTYITNVLAALGSNEPGLATTARFALAKDAAEDPRVLDICRTELNRQPAAVRSAFEAAFSGAPSRKPGA